MKTKQKLVKLIMITLMIYCANQPVFAAENTTLVHDYTAFDTDDYCMNIYNVTIGMKEILSYSSQAEVEQAIIQASKPTIYLRDANRSVTTETLPVEKLTYDFSKLVDEPSSTGYPVTVTAPRIKDPNKDGVIVFNVTVVDDAPHTATVSFADKSLEDQKLSLTFNTTVSLSDVMVTKENYTFAGWYLDAAFTQPFLIPNDSKYQTQRITQDIMLYPKWIEVVQPVVVPTPTPTPGPTPEATVLPEEPQIQDERKATPIAEPTATPEATPVPTIAPTAQPKSEQVTEGSTKSSSTSNVPTAAEYGILGICGAAAGTLGFGIFSDLQVLNWYDRKKQHKDRR